MSWKEEVVRMRNAASERGDEEKGERKRKAAIRA